MRRLALILALWLGLLLPGASAGNYELMDGTHVIGEPIGYNDIGVLIKASDGSLSDRIPWGKFNDDALRKLRDDAKNDQQREIVAPMVSEETAAEKAKFREFTVKPVETPPLATGHLGVMAVLSTPLGWFILLLLHAASIYAASEIAVFRNQSLATVCGLAAIPVVGVATSLYFLSQKSRPRDDEPAPSVAHGSTAPLAMPPAGSASQHSPIATDSAPPPARSQAAPAMPAAAPSQSNFPAPIVYARGDFSFNRRFFETKLPGFFRVVLSEADKDMVIRIKSSRGDFVGKRIPRITPTELYLQVFKEGVTAEEMIPFSEVMEVQVLHKDLV